MTSPAAARNVTLSKSARIGLLLLAVTLLLLQVLPLFNTRWVEDESWYAAAADSLVHQGQLRVPLFAETSREARVDVRPPLPALLMGASFKLLGTNLYSARLPFLLAALAGVVFTYLLGCELVSPLVGILGAILLATENMYFLGARTARPEALLTALDIAGVFLFLYSQRKDSSRWAFVSGIVIGLATLSHPNGFAAAIGVGALALIEFRHKVLLRARSWAFVAGLVLPLVPYVLWANSDALHHAEFIDLYAKGQGVPLSGILSLERSRWADFIGMPSARMKLPVPLPYRLHIVLALLAAGVLLVRFDRRLLATLGSLIAACVLWWAFLRNPTARYMANAAPYFSLLLAGVIAALWDRRPRWRRPVALAAALLVISQIAGNVFLLYLYRTANYTQVTRQLRAVIPPGATVWGALTFWMGLNDHRFYSWNRAPLPYALAHGAQYLILNDRVLVNGSGYGEDDWKQLRTETAAFVARHATLVGHAPNPFYGDLEIYRINPD